MKVNISGTEAIGTPDLEVQEIQISRSPEARRMLFKIIAETLYKDPITANLREYACNAADANVMAGRADVPIEITLPTTLDPVYIVRDFGLGMTPEQVNTVFVQIFESDKRDTNDVTGCMGIGSKCGYAYGPSFMVTSYTGGVKRVYNCYKDNGNPTMALMSESASDSPEGVEVRIPVKSKDVQEFITKAERVYRYFKVRPKIRGVKIEFESRDVSIKGTDWRLCMDRDESVAIMGNIGYPIDTQAMGLTDNRLINLLACGMEIDYPIGDLEISPDREGLLYSEFTKKALLKKLRTCVQEVAAEATKSISAAPTLWEAKTLYRGLYKQLGNSYNRVKSVLDGNVTWRGKPLSDTRHEVKNKEQDPKVHLVRYYLYAAQYRHGRMQREEGDFHTEEVHIDPSWALIINDTKKNVSNSRVRGFFEKNNDVQYIMVFTFDDESAHKRYWKARELEGAPTTLLSTCDPWVDPNKVANGTSSGGPSAHHAKHASRVLKWTGVAPTGFHAARSEWWAAATVDLEKDSGVYVDIENFWISQHKYSPDAFQSAVEGLKAAGVILGDIYGFKPSVIVKITSNWTHIKDHVKQAVAARLSPQEYADWRAARTHKQFLHSSYLKNLNDSTSPAFKYLAALASLGKTKNAALYELTHSSRPWCQNLVPSTLPVPSIDLGHLKKEAMARYPVLSHILGKHWNYSSQGIDFEVEYLNYIKLIDSTTTTTTQKAQNK